MHDQMPPQVFAAIQKHLRHESQLGEQGWQAGEDEEDTLTGHYLGKLQTDRWQVSWTSEGRWRWRIRYKKFGSKGANAPEKHLGADGIIQIELEDVRRKSSHYKGLLFQAKKSGKIQRQKLLKQAKQMEEIAPGGSAVFEYGPRQYLGVKSGLVISQEGAIDENDGIRLGDFLADKFMPCSVGRRGLHYTGGALLVPHETNGVVRIRKKLKHRLTILVQKRDRSVPQE